MTQLSLAFLVAALLGWALYRIVRAGDSLNGSAAEAHPAFIAEAVFSPRDWIFIQQQASSQLHSLFIRERRALAIQWLRDCLARIRTVRASHLRQSRHSQDLNAVAEAKLLLLFFYLSMLCRCLLLAVRFVHPATPYAIALYIQNRAGKVLPAQPTVLSRVPVSEVSRSRL